MTHLRLIHIVLLAGLVWPAAAQQWEERPPMDQPRTGLAAVVLDGQVFLIGGKDRFGNVLDTVVRYDPKSGNLLPLPSMLKARVDAAATVFQERIFVIGGLDGDGNVLDDVEFYDPNSNRWLPFASLTIERQGLVAVASDTSMIVAGGSNQPEQILESIEVYTEAAQAWEASPVNIGGDPLVLGTPRAAFAAAESGGSMFFLGGFGPLGPLDDVEQLSAGFTITPREALPSARGNLAAAAIADSVYAIGGRDGTNRVLADVQRYDPETNTWGEMPRLRIGREGCAAVALEGVLYVFGGSDANGRVLDDVESFGEPEVATATEDEAETPTPGDFGLESNYPNPFQTATTITFTVSEAEKDRHVTLSVYDVLGRRMTTLIDGVLTPGRHTVTWDGRDRSGTPVSGGLYVYRLQQGVLKAHKMMALMR